MARNKVKDDYNVSSTIRYELQRATTIADELRLPNITTVCVLISMFKDEYSIINQIFFQEYGVLLSIDSYIIEFETNKEYYEKITENEYPFQEDNDNDILNLTKEIKSIAADDNDSDTSQSKEEVKNFQLFFYPQPQEEIDFDLAYSKHLKDVIFDTGKRCRACGQNYIDEENLLYSILNLEDCSAKRFLEHILDDLDLTQDISVDIIDIIESLLNEKKIFFDVLENKVVVPKSLENCCKIVNSKYQKGMKCDILDRDSEIFEVWSILSKNQKSNAILLGEAGVGKSAIVEALAMSIVNETCPKKFLGYVIVELNVPSMISGTKYRGEFEKKVEYLIDFITQNEKIIVFVDEVHQIMGAGSSEDSGPDLSGSLKPILARGNVKFIGATTLEEYQKYICRDNAFRRRFEPVIIREPKSDKVLQMLEVKIENLKKIHEVDISNDNLEYIKLLASCFNTSTCNPDKTLDLIDRSMAIASMENSTVVKRGYIEKVFSKNYSKFESLTDELKESTAYHEVGHFIVIRYYKDILVDEEVTAISIIPGFDFLGVNIVESTDLISDMTLEFIDAKVSSLIAGRIAEEKISGKYSAGASNDIKRATELIRKKIMSYGLSSNPDFSNIYLYDSSESCELPISENAINAINSEVSKDMNRIYKKTKEVIEQKWKEISLIANKLLEEKIISAKEVEKLLK